MSGGFKVKEAPWLLVTQPPFDEKFSIRVLDPPPSPDSLGAFKRDVFVAFSDFKNRQTRFRKQSSRASIFVSPARFAPIKKISGNKTTRPNKSLNLLKCLFGENATGSCLPTAVQILISIPGIFSKQLWSDLVDIQSNNDLLNFLPPLTNLQVHNSYKLTAFVMTGRYLVH